MNITDQFRDATFDNPYSMIKESKFFEYTHDQNNQRYTVKFGDLDEYNQFNPDTILVNHVEYGPFDDVNVQIRAILQEKSSQGFEIFPFSIYDYCSQFPSPKKVENPIIPNNEIINKPPKKDNIVQKTIEITPNIKNNMPLVQQQIKEVDIISEHMDNKLELLGESGKVASILEYIYDMETAQGSSAYNEEEKLGEQKGEFDQKVIELGEGLKDIEFEVVAKAQELKLDIEVNKGQATLLGMQEGIIDFMIWLYEQHWNSNSQLVQAMQNKDRKDQIQQMIPLTDFYSHYQNKIQKIADELSVFCEYTSDSILVIGSKKAISDFQEQLSNLEQDQRKLLYPEHWEFLEVEKISEKELPENKEEFQLLHQMFAQNMYGHNYSIQSIKKVQNRSLIEHFVNKVKSIQDTRGKNGTNKRRLMFFGVDNQNNNNNNNPHLYMKGKKYPKPAYLGGHIQQPYNQGNSKSSDYFFTESDVGLDVQFPNYQQGKFGKALYFFDSAQAAYNRNLFFRNDDGSFGLIIADVCYGHTYNAGSKVQSYIKPPQGFDSVSGKDDGDSFVAIYTNFHAYPYYYVSFNMY